MYSPEQVLNEVKHRRTELKDHALGRSPKQRALGMLPTVSDGIPKLERILIENHDGEGTSSDHQSSITVPRMTLLLRGCLWLQASIMMGRATLGNAGGNPSRRCTTEPRAAQSPAPGTNCN